MSTFDDLLAASEASTIEDGRKQIDDTTKSQYDDGFWRPTTDSAGNAMAEIRFLPNPEKGKPNFYLWYAHWFRGPKKADGSPSSKVYNEWCRTTLGEADPVHEHVKPLWNSGSEADKKIARERGRRKNYVANIIVIDDKGNPENNGKVFTFRFGQKILDKIKGAYTPEFAGDDAIDPFNLLGEGANFRLKVKRVGSGSETYPNYDDSSFGPRTPLYNGDRDKMKAAFAGVEIPNIGKYVDPENYKPYDELKKRLDDVLSSDEGVSRRAEDDLPDHEDEKAKEKPKDTGQKSSEAPPKDEEKAPPSSDTGRDDAGGEDDIDFFRRIAEEDK